MTINEIAELLLWGALVNYAVLLIWWGVFVCGRDWVYQLHGRWFQLTPIQFDQIHYLAMAFYKLAIFLFFLAPWIAIQITR